MTKTGSLTFRLPKGWTVRKVANALAREWLPPFLAEAGPKAPRWVIQPVVEAPEGTKSPLWEAGISTEEYEQRLDRPDLTWLIRAGASRGRTKGTVLARLSMNAGDGETLEMSVTGEPVPNSLFNARKVDEFLQGRVDDGVGGLMVELLQAEGFQHVSH